MTNFKCYVVRHDNKDPENFVPLTALPRDLFKPETWKRNNIKEVHVLADTMAFLANDTDKLRELMLPLNSNCVDTVPMRLAKRETVTDNARTDNRPALKHLADGFEKEMERHAR